MVNQINQLTQKDLYQKSLHIDFSAEQNLDYGRTF